MRVSVATPIDMNNFGNRLQNYAVNEICRKMEMQSITIDYPKMYYGVKINTVIRLFRPIVKIPGITHIKLMNKLKKLVCGYEFTRKYIPCFESTNRKKILKKIDTCQLFGIGGDQIWSDYWARQIWYCGYENQSCEKKICFAPSFGKERFSSEEKCEIKKVVLKIAHPAVREISGVELFRELTGNTAIQIVDPVLMISKEEWLKITSAKVTPKEKYILLYFLGNDEQQKEQARKIAEKNNWKLINVLDINDSKHYGIGPAEFIDLINNAQIVFTDSYHGILMSMIMDTPFVICQRKMNNQVSDMNTRIDTLIKLFNIDKALYENVNFSDLSNIYSMKEKYSSLIEKRVERAWEYYNGFIERARI